MRLRLIQVRLCDRKRAVAAVCDGGDTRIVHGTDSTWSLANAAIARGVTLEREILERGLGERVELAALESEGRLLPPIDHPDPAHLHLTGTGLTHFGSAQGRDRMHRDTGTPSDLTDSMRMFQRGVTGGKPGHGECGAQPAWFYKGDGSGIVAPGESLVAPAFALDGGEEPEICGVYLIGPDGTAHRLGFCLANDFSDHALERENYLYLAHSKLRPAALGAELLVGELPQDIRGTSRILRAGAVVWESMFLSGESNMSHSLSNLEHHHFKYSAFRKPGDVHVHFFGTAMLSYADGFATQRGDVFEIFAAPFLVPLRNPLGFGAPQAVDVAVL